MRFRLFLTILLAGPMATACIDTVPSNISTASFEVTVQSPEGCGLIEQGQDTCLYSADPAPFTMSIRALGETGETDTSFNGTVVLSLVPAGIFEDSFLLADGRHVLFQTLTNGEARDVPLAWTLAFGEVRIIAEDLGYTKAAVVSEAACYDLYPSSGCYALDDDDPTVGSGAVGVSEPIGFANPTIHGVQYTEHESVGELRGWPSPLHGFRPTIDANTRQEVPTLASCVDGQGDPRELVVVTAIKVDGFYITDVCNGGGGDPAFASVFVYNFHAPDNLARGDCLLDLTGTVSEFQGFTELKNPFWNVVCDPSDPLCTEPQCTDLLPVPTALGATMLADTALMEELESGLVTLAGATLATEFRSCDLNGNGAIGGSDEWDCSDECGQDIECVVLESYRTYFQWSVNIDGVEVNVKTRGVVDFDPEEHLGETVTRITGTIRHLEFGEPPWTIEPRDENDFTL